MPRSTLLTLLIALSSYLLTGCQSYPGNPISHALPADDSAETELGRAVADANRPELTAVYPLTNSVDAFAARVLLAQAAEKTLDLQYYIWRGDDTGLMLLQSVVEAAERGVRVRLLVDDNGIKEVEPWLATIDQHPNIEVRIFNPFVIRSPKWLSFAVDFSRANRRMHNKVFIADNSVAIAGGRNIGDEYFGASDDVQFADLDVIMAGHVVNQVSSQFDDYWNSVLAQPVSRVLDKPVHEITALQQAIANINNKASAAKYRRALHDSQLIRQLMARELAFLWVPVTMVADDPVKIKGKAKKEQLMLAQLNRVIGEPQHEIDIISPYFVPTKHGTNALIAMRERGVKVRVLTNSLDATDVIAVHSGYAKYRRRLLEAGVELFELRRLGPTGEKVEGTGPFGSSGASLHAKTFSVDHDKVFIGSFNFDPRSAQLNTELGFIIKDDSLAVNASRDFYRALSANAYQVLLDEDGHMYWREQLSNGEWQIYNNEPNASVWSRLGVNALAWLPIEWLL